MKAQRRHELQENELATWLGQHLEQAKPYSKTIVAVLLLAVAAAIAGSYALRDQAARAQIGWTAFYQAFGAQDPNELGDVARLHSGTEAAIWATQAEADLKLNDAVVQIYRSREEAKTLLDEAKTGYETVTKSPAADGLLRERATFGLGRVHETLNELDEAKQYYTELAQGAPQSALGKAAQQRLDTLNDPSVERWYNWFAKQKPRPPASPGIPGAPGMPDLPSDLGNLPDHPDFSLPKPIGPSLPSGADDTAAPPSEEDETAAPTPPATDQNPAAATDEPAAADGESPADTPESSPGEDSEPAEPARSEAPEPASDSEASPPGSESNPQPEPNAESDSEEGSN